MCRVGAASQCAYFKQNMTPFWGMCDAESSQRRLAAVRKRRIRVRAAVDGTAGMRHRLAVATGHDAQHRCDDGQHQDQAGDGDGNGERALRHAQSVLGRLQWARMEERLIMYPQLKRLD